jgi:CheY-like chemotaxis protein
MSRDSEIGAIKSKAPYGRDVGAEAPPGVGGGAKRILVIDDNHDGADLLAELLQELGHTVQIAHDGPAALAVSASFHPEIAFVDIGLPTMDGYEVARRLRAMDSAGHGAGLRLVALTGYDLDDSGAHVAEAGFQKHLLKPVDFSELEHVIEELRT